MKKIAIFYATTEGQTSKIAEAIAREFSSMNFATHLVRANDSPWIFEARNYDGVVIGASVHIGRFPLSFRRQVRENAAEIRKVPSAFFSVCLGILDKVHPQSRDAERKIVRDFLERAEVRPALQAIFGGAIRYSKYGFLKRMALHAIAQKAGAETRTDRDYEFTDWDEVRKFARDFVDRLERKVPVESPPRKRGDSDALEPECCP